MLASFKSNNNNASLPLEFGLVVCWSSGFIGAILASEASSVFLVLFCRFVVTSFLLLPFALPYLRVRYMRAIATQSLIGSFAMFGCLASSVRAIDLGVPSGTVALIAAAQPIATAIFAGIFLGETIARVQWFGLCLGAAGVALAVGGEAGQAPIYGFILCFVSVATLMVGSLISKGSTEILPLLATLFIHCSVFAFLFMMVAWSDGIPKPETSLKFWYAIAFYLLLPTLGGYVLYWACLRRMTATRVASLMYLTPPITMIWAWAMFGEKIHSTAVCGFLLCVSGIYFIRRPRTCPSII